MVFLVFGWGHRKVEDRGSLPSRSCPRCRNESPWRLQTVSEWVTLFFVPVLPLRRRHVAVCPVCGYDQDLSEAQLAEARRLGRI